MHTLLKQTSSIGPCLPVLFFFQKVQCGAWLTLKTLRSKFVFSFVAPIHFEQKLWGEVDNISSKFILCDNVCNSHDHSVLQSIDITRRSLMLTLRGHAFVSVLSGFLYLAGYF